MFPRLKIFLLTIDNKKAKAKLKYVNPVKHIRVFRRLIDNFA